LPASLLVPLKGSSMASKHVTVTTTAAETVLTIPEGESPASMAYVVNLNAGDDDDVYFTITGDGNTAPTATVKGDGTYVACKGNSAVPVVLGVSRTGKVSAIVGTTSTDIAIYAP